ncbi:unnamed protein product [Prunus brigantina]
MAQEMSPQKKEAQNQPKRRIKMMAQKSKPKPKQKPNNDRKAKHLDYVQFRCNVNAFNSIITDVKDKLNERQKKLLKKNPLWNLIELFYHQRIDMNNMNKYTSTFRTRHFGEKGKPSKNQVEAELLKTISLANQPKKEKAKAEQKKKTNKGKEKKRKERS